MEPLLDLGSVVVFAVALFAACHNYARLQVVFRSIIFTLLCVFTFTFFFREYETASILWFYVFPPVVFYLLGLREGIFWLIPFFVPVLLLCFAPGVFPIKPLGVPFILRFLTSLTLLTFFSAVVESLRMGSLSALVQANRDLQKATEELTELSGLTPICSYCKRIRDDKGYWNDLEAYLASHSRAQISTGLCDACAKEAGNDAPARGATGELSNLLAGRLRAHEDHEKAKRLFVLRTSVLILFAIWGFAARDLWQGNILEGAVQFGFSLVFLGGVITLWRNKGTAVIYSLMLGVIFILLVHPFFGSAPELPEFLWLFLFIVPANYLRGAKKGFFWSMGLLLVALVIFLEPPFLTKVPGSAGFAVLFPMAYIVVFLISWNMERLRERYTRSMELSLDQIRETYMSIRTLKGLVPVCASCKAMRDDEGFWSSVEVYLGAHTHIDLTHGICADCLEKEFPDVYEIMLKEEKIPPPPERS
ncbi:hypothetical protein KKF84_11060 [Myxococcota bacterium]|nr:hypothetical protein [Myxococcota bacterium]MBU1535850.1 hypothetical protein [Myxococcota bacterium]